MEVVGIVLGTGEGFEAIEGEVLLESETVESLGMENEGLAGQAGVTVRKEVRRDPEGAARLPDPGPADEEVLD
jgi:hypothetical protein